VPTNELIFEGDALSLLTNGEIEVVQRMPYSSNATFLVTVSLGDQKTQAIYKPLRGERPLWDFGPGLHRREAFRDMCAFDIVANNTDRKAGHCLIDKNQQVWGIDHGVCFSADFKLRTVIWEFGGEELPPSLITACANLAKTVPLGVATLLADDEISALQERAQWLVDGGAFPVDRSRSRYPWPLV